MAVSVSGWDIASSKHVSMVVLACPIITPMRSYEHRLLGIGMTGDGEPREQLAYHTQVSLENAVKMSVEM